MSYYSWHSSLGTYFVGFLHNFGPWAHTVSEAWNCFILKHFRKTISKCNTPSNKPWKRLLSEEFRSVLLYFLSILLLSFSTQILTSKKTVWKLLSATLNVSNYLIAFLISSRVTFNTLRQDWQSPRINKTRNVMDDSGIVHTHGHNHTHGKW